MINKVYAVYSIPKSPEYRLEKLFTNKESAKKYISIRKSEDQIYGGVRTPCEKNIIFDLQIEDVIE